MSADPGLVSYENPPVSETSVGMQFASIPGWDLHLFGLYFERLRRRYPRFASAPPFVFDYQAPVPSAIPRVRGLYYSEQDVRVVQLQDNAFFVNWKKATGSEPYPRYSGLRARFLEDWDDLVALLTMTSGELPVVKKYQLAYINHIDDDDLTAVDVVSAWHQPSDAETRLLTTTYDFPGRNVEITISLHPVVRVTDNRPVKQMTIITARPAREGDRGAEAMSAFDDLHSVLIETFQSMTSSRAKARWRPIAK